MNFIRYLFSDKGSAPTWIMIFIGVLIFTGIYYILRISVPENYNENYPSILGLTILGIYIVIFIGFYLMSYSNYSYQFQFKAMYANKITENKSLKVEIYQDSFTIKPIRQNYDALIKIKPKLDSFELLLIDGSEFLLGQVSEMGLFRYHLRPIMIKKGKDDSNKYRKVILPEFRNVDKHDDDLILRFSKSYKGINTIIIKDYTNSSATNRRQPIGC